MPDRINAGYYVKLGTDGLWADDSIQQGIVRLGWPQVPLSDIHSENWTAIHEKLMPSNRTKGAATTDTNRLRHLATSSPQDVWISFHKSRLFWGRMAASPIEEDDTSKFRRLSFGWSDKDTSGRLLLANQIPGAIAKLQGFRATVCSVRERDQLERLLYAENSAEFEALSARRQELEAAVVGAVRQLHWKDFETLVDLVFRQAGWRRRSVLGETMKFADIELEEPITRDGYQVQIKARADIGDYNAYADAFSARGFRRLYFVVHSPTEALRAAPSTEEVELILPERLAAMIVEFGLLGWLADRIR